MTSRPSRWDDRHAPVNAIGAETGSIVRTPLRGNLGSVVQMQMLAGNRATVAALRTGPVIQREPWDEGWAAEIQTMTIGNRVLGKDNANYKQAAKKYDGFADWVESFKEALLRGTAAQARALVQQLAPQRDEKGRIAGDGQDRKIPTAMISELYEMVSAKVLYAAGDHSLLPGSDVKSENKKGAANAVLKPDYFLRGDNGSVGDLKGGVVETDAAEWTIGRVGDHIRLAAPKTPKDVCTSVAVEALDKLTTYPQFMVSVVVDVTDSLGARDPDYAHVQKADFVGALKAAIRDVKTLGRLERLTVVKESSTLVITNEELR